MDLLTSVSALVYEGEKVGYRIIGHRASYDLSLDDLRQAGVRITGVKTQIRLYDGPDGVLHSDSERKGKKIEDGASNLSEVYILLSQYPHVRYLKRAGHRFLTLGVLYGHLKEVINPDIEIHCVYHANHLTGDKDYRFVLHEKGISVDYMYTGKNEKTHAVDTDGRIIDTGVVLMLGPENFDSYGTMELWYDVFSERYPMGTREEWAALGTACGAR